MEHAGFLPARIVAGESIWLSASNTAQDGEDLIFDNYTPAGGYTLAYQFAAATPISVAGAANGANTGWTLEVTGAQTLLWAPGTIVFAGLVTHTASGRIFSVDAGVVGVEASPLRVSSWVAVVAACDAAILAHATAGTVNFGVDGLSVTYNSPSQLIDLRAYAQYMLAQDSGKRRSRIIRTEFTLV